LVEELERNEEASAAGSLAMQDDATPMHGVVVPYRHGGWIVEDRLLYLPLLEFVLVPELSSTSCGNHTHVILTTLQFVVHEVKGCPIQGTQAQSPVSS
jgi:hypothetical protein